MLYEQNNLVGVSIDKVNAATRVRWVLREPNLRLSGVRGRRHHTSVGACQFEATLVGYRESGGLFIQNPHQDRQLLRG